jgi:putative transposase
MMTKPIKMTVYPTNLSNSQWQIISKCLDTKRKRKYSLRELVNGILYLVKTGCQWRMLPSDFPHWKLVYYYFSVWKKAGIIEHIHETLVEKTRKRHGRNEEPSVGIIDAQSVKNTLISCEDKGFDAGKRIKGIKRHIMVDTMGLILAVVIQSAGVQDRNGGIEVVEKLVENWKSIVKIFADGGYSGTLVDKIRQRFNIVVEIIKRDELHRFKVLPKRWIVERTFAWLDTNRRNSKHYERLNDTAVAMVQLSAIRIMINRF